MRLYWEKDLGWLIPAPDLNFKYRLAMQILPNERGWCQ